MESRHTGGNFKVIIAPIELTGNFSAVSGLNAELECEEYIEGGTFGRCTSRKGCGTAGSFFSGELQRWNRWRCGLIR